MPHPPAPRGDCASATTLFGRARVSAQRAAIADVVPLMRGAFTAEELHRSVAERTPGIGLATIYRAIAAMQEAGTLATVGERDGSALLAVCARHDHHHHLVCTGCGGVVGIECPIEEATLNAAERGGHLVTSHQIVLYGLCNLCREREGA